MSPCIIASDPARATFPAYFFDSHTGSVHIYMFAGIDEQGRTYGTYATTRLKRPLIAGKQYCLAVYYRNHNPLLDANKASTYGLGLYLSNVIPRADTNERAIRQTPVVVNLTTSSDLKWKLLKGCYRAKGGEEYLTIGVFHNDILRIPGTYVPVAGAQPEYSQGSRYVFDDVSVIPVEDAQILGADTSLCAGESIKLKTRMPCANTYRWSDNTSDSTLTVTRAGRYWVEIQTDCGLLRDTIFVRERKNDLNLGPDTTLCNGRSLTLYAPEGASLIRWDDDSGRPQRVVNKPGTYWAYTEQNGCSKRDEITLTLAYPPWLTLVADTNRCDDAPAVQVRVGPPTYRYRWADGPTDSVRLFTDAGTYTVLAENGCGTAQGQVTISVSDCQCRLYWPTAFTPNGDGLNDVFTGFIDCQYRAIKSLEWRVFNRWGEVVYQATSLTAGWDGNYRGDGAPTGSYTYRLLLTTEQEGKPHISTFTGSVQLLH